MIMTESAAAIIDSLIQLNHKKLRLLSTLGELTRLQELDLSSNSLNSLLDHIHQKQDVIQNIDAVDREFYKAFVEIRANLGLTSLTDIDPSEFPQVIELKSTVSLIMQKLSEIESLDKNNMKAVGEEIEKVKGNMKTLSSQTKATKVYGAGYKNDAPGFFIDSKK